MAAWTPPSFRYYREADGTVTILDEKGNTVPSPPTMKHIGANGDAKMLDPWGNEVPEYVPTYPDGFFIHTFPDGSMTAVDGSGVPLPIQPEMGHGGPEMLAESDYAVLPDGTMYEAPAYEFPDGFFIHTFPDGSMTAVDGSGVPLPIQPEMGHGGPEMLAESDYAVLPDGTMYEAPAYEFPDGFFIHTFPDGSMTAVDGSGVPLPIQPEMGHGGPEMLAESDYAVLPDGTMYEAPAYEFPDGFFIHTFPDGSMTAVDGSGVPLPIQPEMGHGGPEMLAESDYAVLPDGTMYEAPAYEFPDGFFIHTFPDGSMTAVDGSGVPLPIQPEMGHGGPEMLAESDYAVLPDGTMYIPPPLYPPAGEPPEEWPPVGWGAEDESAPNDTSDENDAPESVEAAADQGPDTGSADPADPVSVSDGVGEDPRTQIGTDLSAEGAVEDVEAVALTDDARTGAEAAAEGSLDRDVSDLLTAGLVQAPPEMDASAFPEASVAGDEVSATPIPLPGDPEPVPVEGIAVLPIPLPGEELPVGGDEVSATPIPLPGDPEPVPVEGIAVLPVPVPGAAMPVGGDEVSATPIPLPGDPEPVPVEGIAVLPVPVPGAAMPVGGDEVSATPIPLPGQELPVGVDEVSGLPIPIPDEEVPVGEIPVGTSAELDRVVDDEIALDRKGDDAPVGVGIGDALPTDAEFIVEVVEEIHVEEVRLEEVEIESVERVVPIVDTEDLALDDEGIDELDS